ncbi:hypothetical protein D3C81_1083640 [compost metagenome]
MVLIGCSVLTTGEMVQTRNLKSSSFKHLTASWSHCTARVISISSSVIYVVMRTSKGEYEHQATEGYIGSHNGNHNQGD